ncbi:hypothetical protein EVAR_61029_1 [Eumeta japonica]|uniref:Uncharacterized protein n=1 Tax=Eumeta variegata TaxID=151549 RepID=A0A4C1ZLA2_EUMVA|nr:hypothetical protein EVAR_61029_1 [Eumeta japonica]
MGNGGYVFARGYAKEIHYSTQLHVTGPARSMGTEGQGSPLLCRLVGPDTDACFIGVGDHDRDSSPLEAADLATTTLAVM